MDAHVGGGFFGRCNLGDPESPEDFAAAHGDALEGHGNAEEQEVGSEKEESDAGEEAEVEEVAGGDKVQSVEEASP